MKWQFFSGMAVYEPRLPCDATQIGRFRRSVSEEGLEQFKATIETAVELTAIKPVEFERVMVDSTVRSEAIEPMIGHTRSGTEPRLRNQPGRPTIPRPASSRLKTPLQSATPA